MEIAYRLNNKEIEKLKKYKNPSIILKKGYFKKWKIQVTFNYWNV